MERIGAQVAPLRKQADFQQVVVDERTYRIFAGGKQMNVEQSMCAASDPAARWEQVDWSRCEHKVRRLQARIVKATQEGRHGKV